MQLGSGYGAAIGKMILIAFLPFVFLLFFSMNIYIRNRGGKTKLIKMILLITASIWLYLVITL